MADISTINDEDVLRKMMNATDNFEERKKIRLRMRELREAHTAAYEAQKAARDSENLSAVELRQRQAQREKERKMQDFAKEAEGGRKESNIMEQELRRKRAEAEADKQKKLEDMKEMGKTMAATHHAGADIIAKAEKKGRNVLEGKESEDSVSRTTKTETGADGRLTTTTSTTTQRTKDGTSTSVKQTKQITQTSGVGGTTYTVKKTSATQQKSGAGSARAAFQQMDSKNPGTGTSGGASFGGKAGGGKVSIQRSPSAIKQMLLDWCKAQTQGYEHVDVTNFSSSWNNGMAFCALIHRFYPHAFTYSRLDPRKRRANFTLAFDVAEKYADIAPLLEVDDMVRMKNPDWKCVFCYIQSFYRKFRDFDPTKEQKAED